MASHRTVSTVPASARSAVRVVKEWAHDSVPTLNPASPVTEATAARRVSQSNPRRRNDSAVRSRSPKFSRSGSKETISMAPEVSA